MITGVMVGHPRPGCTERSSGATAGEVTDTTGIVVQTLETREVCPGSGQTEQDPEPQQQHGTRPRVPRSHRPFPEGPLPMSRQENKGGGQPRERAGGV